MDHIDKIANELFDKLRSRFDAVVLGNKQGKSTDVPSEARFFNFNYSDNEGNNFGHVLISIVDGKSLRITYSKNLVSLMDRDQRQQWYEFLRNLRSFTQRHNPPLKTFDVRDINKDNLSLRDIQQQATSDDTFTSDDIKVTESRLYGSSQRSYAVEGNCKLVIHHENMVNDDVHGSRSRHINKIFIETPLGERFLMPFKNLDGARAMARHITEGGSMHDELAEHICNMVHEMNCMRTFVNGTKRRQFEDADTQDMVHSAVRHYDQLRRTLRIMRGARGHRAYLENFHPELPLEEEIDIAALRERFVKKVYNDKFTEALPYVYRAHRRQQESAGYSQELEEWVATLAETDWHDSHSVDTVEKVQELFSSPVMLGLNAIDAINDIENLDLDMPMDDLRDKLQDMASVNGPGPDTDARGIIKVWLKQNAPEIMSQVNIGSDNVDDATTNFEPQTSPKVDNSEYGSQPAHPNHDNMAMESHDLAWLRSLAGLKR